VNGAWTGWYSPGRPDGITLHSLAVGTNPDGRLEVFAADGNGQLRHVWQTAPSASGAWDLGLWDFFNPATGETDTLGANVRSISSVGRMSDGRIVVFVVDNNGVIWYDMQLYVPPGSVPWTGFQRLF
jgi:hypothetical protein